MKARSLGLVLGSAALASADCAATSFNEGGNFFCQAVSRIQYANVGHTATYDQVVVMDQNTGACQKQPKSYAGPMAPFDEEMSIHLRGPLRLRQFAAYTLGGARKRDEEAVAHAAEEGSPVVKRSGAHHNVHRHSHAHLHEKRNKKARRSSPKVDAPEEEVVEKKKRHEDVWVTATIDGQVQSWLNDWWPDEATPAPVPVPAAGIQGQVRAPTPNALPEPAPVAAPGIYRSGKPAVVNDWTRIGYYDAASQTAQGVVFLGNFGGEGSGKFTYTFGNTLAFANAQGTGGAAGAQVLADTLLPSNKEVIIFSDRPCNGDCGFYQDGTVAYHGFGGADKVWLFEVMMPHDGVTGVNGDMPSLWSLNAQIPRTSQYGSCSCWTSGCGEFDILEVLASGDNKCKSTFHLGLGGGGGSSDFFDRPVDKYIKVAVVFDSGSRSATVKILPDSTSFAAGLSREQVNSFIAEAGSLGLSTLFTLP